MIRYELSILPPHAAPANDLRDPPPHVFTGIISTVATLIYASVCTLVFGSAPSAWFFAMSFAAYTLSIVLVWALVSVRPWYRERRRRHTLMRRFADDKLKPLSPEWREALALAPDHDALPFSLSFMLTTMGDEQLWKVALDVDDPCERHARDELIRRARENIERLVVESRERVCTSVYR